jgi:DMSO/TMAO reductase YedYZ heme-binding membrane subunit
MHKPSSLRDYLIAGLIATSLFVFFCLYLSFRHGALFGAPMTDTLYYPNKALAGVAMTMLALTFLIGPIVRYFDRYDTWLSYRKEIGILAGFLAVIHGLVSYYLLPIKFPRVWIEFSAIEFCAGLVGAILLVALFVLSWKSIILLVGGGTWWFLQRWGLRVTVIATLIHVYVMKWSSWVTWYTTGNNLPALGLLLTLFITWVVVVRLYESLFLFRACGFATKEICMDIEIKSRGRRFFLTSFVVYALLTAFMLLRPLF